jgi:hypothetical protein
MQFTTRVHNSSRKQKRNSQLWLGLATALLVLSLAEHVEAQPLTPTISPNASPITVSTQPEKIAVRPKVADQTIVNVAFGATANGGNTKSYGGTLGGRIGQIRDRHQITLEALGSMGGARQQSLRDVKWTSSNAVARARYDLFLSEHDALFVALAPRRDRFAGLDIRLQSQVGYLRNLFFFSDAHRFWSELGYDFTYDNLSIVERTPADDVTDEVRAVAPELVPDGSTITRTVKVREHGGTQFVHSARLFLGYTNRLFASANLSVGVETLLDFQDKKNVRVNGLAELTSSITHSFKFGVQGRVLFDNVPVPGTRPYDTVTAVQLVYTFDSAAGALNAPCPVCDCTSQVQSTIAACRSKEALPQ